MCRNTIRPTSGDLRRGATIRRSIMPDTALAFILGSTWDCTSAVGAVGATAAGVGAGARTGSVARCSSTAGCFTDMGSAVGSIRAGRAGTGRDRRLGHPPPSPATPPYPPIDLAARAVQHFPRQRPLNLLEEFVLFPPDVPREQRAKLLQQRPSWRSAQLRNLTLHRAVFRHQERDQGHRAARRKQHLLLDLEMIDEFQFIPVRCAPRQLRYVPWRGVRGQGSPRYYAQGESVMVLVREGNQTGIAQHRLLPCYYTAPAIAR